TFPTTASPPRGQTRSRLLASPYGERESSQQRMEEWSMVRLMNLSNADIDSDYNLEDYDARDATGDKMGSVDSVIVDSDTMQPRYLVIDSGGWFSSNKYVVPMGEVDHVNDDDQDVFFRTLTKDQLKNGGYPAYDDS